MNRLVLLLLLFASPGYHASAQLLLRITGIPASHEAGESIYVAGNFNGWQPNLPDYELKMGEDGNYHILLPFRDQPLEFKFTRGSWDSEEVDSSGNVITNRLVRMGHTEEELVCRIAGWKDRDGIASPVNHSASAQVHIISDSIFIESLGRYRRAWIYLPKGYAESDERYPVLYMHDGQNVFDAATSYSGEWGVDETIDGLNLPLIVVALDNGSEHRIDEYTPYQNAEYGGGEGAAYVDFLVEEFKPFIDAEYRTMPEAEHTGLMGSSLGSLITYYAALKHPNTFRKLGLFSSALWINYEQIFAIGKENPLDPDTRIYLLVGGAEGPTMVPHTRELESLLQSQGINGLKTVVDEDGRHHESFWKDYMEESLRWLYPELFE